LEPVHNIVNLREKNIYATRLLFVFVPCTKTVKGLNYFRITLTVGHFFCVFKLTHFSIDEIFSVLQCKVCNKFIEMHNKINMFCLTIILRKVMR